MTNTMDMHFSHANLNWYQVMPEEMVRELRKRRISAVIAGSDIHDDDARIAKLAAEQHIDEVLVLRLNAVGIVRHYNGFIPLSKPEGYCILSGELIDPAIKKVLWRHLAEVKIPVQGEWDQPPSYPNLTVAMNQAVSASRQEIFDSLLSGH